MFDLPMSPLMSWILFVAVIVLSICIVYFLGFCLLSVGKKADENQEKREHEIINELDNKYKDKY